VPESWTVPGVLDGERLDRAVALVTGLSRRQAGELVDAEKVRLGGRVVTTRSRKVRSGDRVEVEMPESTSGTALTPDPDVMVPVVYQDEHLIVVDKPAGLVVHPGAGRAGGTMVQGLLAAFPDLAGLIADAPDRPGIIHRLDRGTSGLLVVARTARAKSNLAHQLGTRSMGREYIALVAGRMEADRGVVDAPLGRSASDPTRIRVQAGGRPARTHYEVEDRFEVPVSTTLLRCRLETGRTHQIRVHLSSIGNPVVGDERYGGRPDAGPSRQLTDLLPPGRPFLHAAVLSFLHPESGERFTLSAPLPVDLLSVLDSVRHAG
jgi:23S rRNA pseudouridine1911/1915/1917 synthase